MSRPATTVLLALMTILAGCAAADPTGGMFGKPADTYVGSADRSRKSRCPAGETLVCETKSPNRVSDGRYGFRKNRKQERCGCQPDRYLDRMSGGVLPTPREL
ncbi:MAG: hypothetical protein R3315_00915 [Woeseiaceae bacterium]|nr:hypothetical protein [Woeseiaceae bacterium]